MKCESIAQSRFRFGGLLGQRIDANETHWLLRAPQDNPGLLNMFRVRDSKPEPDLVPWAGEFVGKYLLSAIQALRLSDNPKLREQTKRIVADLISTQAEDGYMGPFPRAVRLKAHWDLWGHYHCLLALLMWHEDTGNEAALTAARKIGDLICATFLNTKLRVRDAGSPEMNMAIIHGLGALYRHTKEPRYLAMMRDIETDWETAGDYMRQGVAGVPFYQTPRPRWESLHDLQGLVELYRITGDAQYKLAFENHWRSILRWDRHNSGAFSTGEGAIGNPYAPGAIETCCTIAWMAVSLDMLRLTGDSRVADELELSTWNACLGAQHPTGEWWTYDTPMAGTRVPSFKSIAFQARPGTPELNCCSVNGPRGLGMLTEWAVMSAPDGLMVNFYGPGSFTGKLPDQTPITLTWETTYPSDGLVRLRVSPSQPHRFAMKLRIPAWSQQTTVSVNGKAATGKTIVPGHYLTLLNEWKAGDTITLNFDMRLRVLPGAREATGHVSLYQGPLLLAYDTRDNSAPLAHIPALSNSLFSSDMRATRKGVNNNSPSPSDKGLIERVQSEADTLPYDRGGDVHKWTPGVRFLHLNISAVGGQTVTLRDFASAGANGTEYASWLPVQDGPLPPSEHKIPSDGATIPVGKMLFQWTAPKQPAPERSYQLVVAETEDFAHPLLQRDNLREGRLVVDAGELPTWKANRWYYWKVVVREGTRVTASDLLPARFRVDARLPALPETYFAPKSPPANDLLVQDDLRGKPAPVVGSLQPVSGFVSAPGAGGEANGAVDLNGSTEMLRYSIGAFPEEDYSVCITARVAQLPTGLGQIFSAWAVSQDDPLRICVDNGKLFARMETGGNGFSTEGIPVSLNTWMRIVVVKEEATLALYVDGVSRGVCHVPTVVRSHATDIALGGNPHYAGKEFLAVRLSDFRFYARALSPQEAAAQSRH